MEKVRDIQELCSREGQPMREIPEKNREKPELRMCEKEMLKTELWTSEMASCIKAAEPDNLSLILRSHVMIQNT